MVNTSVPQPMSRPRALGLPEEQLTNEDLARIAFRPTVVVGLGGSGTAIVRKMKRLLYDYLPENRRDIFQFVAIDTDTQQTPPDELPLASPGEFFHIASFNASQYIHNRDTNEVLRKWWPRKKDGSPHWVTYSGQGAHQQRPVGRLAFFQSFQQIQTTLEAKIRAAVEIQKAIDLGPQSAKVYIISSVAGGTGSGMLIDIAYLLRNEFSKAVTRDTFVTGMLLMPDIFTPKASSGNEALQMRANGYAALRELNHYTSTKSFRGEYSIGYTIQQFQDRPAFRPFDVCYLLGLTNRRQALPDLDDVEEMAALQLIEEILTPIGNANNSIVDNQAVLEGYVGDQPTAYSSFAVASLGFPRQGMAGWFALRFTPSLVRDVLLKPLLSTQESDSEVGQFITTAELEEDPGDQVTAALKMGEDGLAIAPRTPQFDTFSSVPNDLILGLLQREEKLCEASLEEARGRVERRMPGLQAEKVRLIRTEFSRLVTDPQRGPQYAAWWLEKVRTRFILFQEECMDREREQLAQSATASAAEYTSAKESLEQALQRRIRLPLQRRVSDHLQDCVSALERTVTNNFESFVREQASRLYIALIKIIQGLDEHVRGLIRRLGEAATVSQLRGESEEVGTRLAAQNYVLAQDVTGPERKIEIYDATRPPIDTPTARRDLASNFWAYFTRKCPAWNVQSSALPGTEEAPEAQIYYYLSEYFLDQLTQETLLNFLREVTPNAEQVLSGRMADADPFWRPTVAAYEPEVQSGLATVRLVGYGEPESTGWSDKLRRAMAVPLTTVNTKDSSTMVFVQIAHGRPLYTLSPLQSSGDMAQAYDLLLDRWQQEKLGARPLHILDTPMSELLPIDHDPVRPQAAPPKAPPPKAPTPKTAAQRKPARPGPEAIGGRLADTNTGRRVAPTPISHPRRKAAQE